MNKLYPIVAAASLLGCAAADESATLACRSDSIADISIAHVRSRGELRTIRIQNGSECSVLIQGWSKKGRGPVAYCKNDSSEPSLCSEKIMLIDLTGDGFVPYDTLLTLNAGQTVEFRIRPAGADYVGVRLYAEGVVGGEFVWTALQQ